MTSASEYSITVESCVRQGSKFVWTLLLRGFKEGEYIYIYRNSEKITTAGHCIKFPAAPIVIDSWETDLFKDISKQEEYHFRVYSSNWTIARRLAAEKLMPVFFPPAEVKAFADAKVAAQLQAEIDASIAAVAAAAKAKEDADRKAKEDADAKAKEAAKAEEDAQRKAKEVADAKAKKIAADMAEKIAAEEAKKRSDDHAARRLGYASAEDKRQKEAVAEARADLESKVNVAVQRRFEANDNRTKLDDLSQGRFTKMSIKAFLTSKGLDDDHWFEEMEKLKEVLPQLQSDYEEANKVWTQHDAEHTLAQSKLTAAQQISDAAGTQYRNASAAASSALARLQRAKENLAKSEKAEKEIIATVQNRKTLGISALAFVLAAVFFENFIVNSEKSWSLFPSACIEIGIASFSIGEHAWFVQPAASATFILAGTCAFWGLLSALRMAKDVSEMKKRALAAISPAAEAEHAHSLLKDQARGEQEALNVAQKHTDSARQVLDGITRKLGEARRDKDAKDRKMTTSAAKFRQHQLHFDQTKIQYERAMAFDEKQHNENLAAKCEAASSKVRVSDAAAAAAYDLAAAAWTCLAAMEETGAHVKPKMKKAETGTFEYFFKQKMEEETQRRVQREIDIQNEIDRQNRKNRPKEGRSSPGPDLSFVWDLIREKTPKELQDERDNGGSNPGGCGGMDTSVRGPPCPVQ